MVDYTYRRTAYKAARARVRNVMIERNLDRPAIIAIAKHFLDTEYPGAGVDLKDLADACEHYQHNTPRLHMKLER